MLPRVLGERRRWRRRGTQDHLQRLPRGKEESKAAESLALEKSLTRLKGKEKKEAEELLKKTKATLKGFTGEIAEVAKDAERVVKVAERCKGSF